MANLSAPISFKGIGGFELIPLRNIQLEANTPYTINLANIQLKAGLTPVKAIGITNPIGSKPITVFSKESQIRVECPAYCQLWSPFFVPIPGTIELTCEEATIIDVTISNEIIPPSVWSAAGVPLLRGNNDEIFPSRIGNQTINGGGSAVSGNIIPASAGKRWFITSLHVSLTADWVCATGGVIVSIVEETSGEVVFSQRIAARAADPNLPYILFSQSGIFHQATVENKGLNYTLSGALTSGQLQVLVKYGRTSLPT